MKERKVPMRRCIGCMESKEKKELIRLTAYEGEIKADPTGRARGRGAYICIGSPECLKKAFKRNSFERTLGVSPSQQQKETLMLQMEEINKKNER